MNTISEMPNLENKKILFLAETHFQLMNCINIACHINNSQCFLFINEMYKDAGDYAKKIYNTGLFQEVKTYSVTFSKAEKAIKFLTFKKYILKTIGNYDYDFVFFASRDFLTRCVITYYKYVDSSTKLISYDEGLGTYISRMEEYTNSFEKNVIKFLYHRNPSIVTDKILYMPEAYIGGADNVTLYKMPFLNKSVIGILNQVYDYDDSLQFNERYIYFDSYYDKDKEKEAIINTLIKATKGQLLIKKHPQTPDGAYDYDKVYHNSSLPYEIIAANDGDIENRTLITIMSTSVWTPVLLFNKHPQLILLYPLLNNNVVNEANDIIEKMISLYPKEKVIVMTNLEDLETIEKR